MSELDAYRQRVADAIADHERLTERVDAVMEWVVIPRLAERDRLRAENSELGRALHRVRDVCDRTIRQLPYRRPNPEHLVADVRQAARTTPDGGSDG